jgi:hypothetical protein
VCGGYVAGEWFPLFASKCVGGMNMKQENTDRMTKWRTDQICFPRDLNIHDPDNKYRWQEEEAQAPAWVWAMRGLGVVGFVVGIYMLTLLTFLF